MKYLKRFYNYDSFRKGQDEIIRTVLEGHNTLGVMPTGGGKSLCYQIPALCFDGLSIVISPLISLMKDQIDTLKACKYPAEMINSTVHPYEQRQIMAATASGELKLLYLTPERLRNQNFLKWLQEQKIV